MLQAMSASKRKQNAKSKGGVREGARPVRRTTSGLPRRWAVGLPILLAIIVYLPTLGYGFVWDDVNFIVENPASHELSSLPEALGHGYGWVPTLMERPDAFLYFRPVIVISNTVQWVLSGGSPWLFHLVNLLTHAVTAGLIAGTLLLLGLLPEVALLAGGLFAVHPIHSEAVAWICGRTDLTAAVFAMMAVSLLAAWIRRQRVPVRAPLPLLLGAAVLLALLSKESAVPIAVLVPFIVAIGQDRPGPARTATDKGPAVTAGSLWLVLGGAVLLYLLMRFLVLGGDMAGGGSWQEAGQAPARGHLGLRLVLGGNLFLLYLWRLILPWPLSMDPPPALAHPPYPAFPGLVGLVLLAGLGGLWIHWYLRRLRDPDRGETGPIGREAGLLLGLGVFLLGILPVLQIIPTGEVYGERFLYLPFAGLLIFLATLGHGLWAGRPRWALGFLVILAVPSVVALQSRLPDWQDELHLFTRAAQVHPESARARANLGAALMDAGRPTDALPELREAVRLDPDDALKQAQLGSLLINMGQVPEGVALLEVAQAQGKTSRTLLLNLGIGRTKQGRFDEAAALLGQARTLTPQDPLVLEALATAERKRGRFHAADRLYQDALCIEPGRKSCYLNLFGMHYFDRRDLQRARQWGGEFLRRFPQAPEAEQTRQLMERPPGD